MRALGGSVGPPIEGLVGPARSPWRARHYREFRASLRPFSGECGLSKFRVLVVLGCSARVFGLPSRTRRLAGVGWMLFPRGSSLISASGVIEVLHPGDPCQPARVNLSSFPLAPTRGGSACSFRRSGARSAAVAHTQPPGASTPKPSWSAGAAPSRGRASSSTSRAAKAAAAASRFTTTSVRRLLSDEIGHWPNRCPLRAAGKLNTSGRFYSRGLSAAALFGRLLVR